MARNSGPTGAGLIPPQAGGAPSDPPQDTDVDDHDDDLGPSGDENDGGEDVDLTGVPPVDDADEDDDDDTVDGVDIAEIERRVEERLQRRFDRAISKATRRLQSQQRQPDPADDDDHDDDDDDTPPPRQERRQPSRRRESQRRSDSIALRSLARDRLEDEMSTSGRSAQIAVKRALDSIIPHLREEDADDVIDDVVAALAGTAGDLIKIGSDRKVRQLQGLGMLPTTPTQQNGGSSGRRKTDPATAMRRGAAIAAERHPRTRSGR